MHRSIAELICQSQTFVVKWNESAYILLAYICLTLSYVILLFANYSRLHKTKMFGHVFGLPPIYRWGLGQFFAAIFIAKVWRSKIWKPKIAYSRIYNCMHVPINAFLSNATDQECCCQWEYFWKSISINKFNKKIVLFRSIFASMYIFTY